jgi:hypothetical protein
VLGQIAAPSGSGAPDRSAGSSFLARHPAAEPFSRNHRNFRRYLEFVSQFATLAEKQRRRTERPAANG